MTDRYVPEGTSIPGGLGSIEVRRDTNLDRKVAIKYTWQRSRLLDEIKALQRVQSNHVVQVYDIFNTDSSRIGIVQEYIDGEELSSKLAEIEPGEEFVYLLYQLASGLADIHAEGIVHRDIKPNNVLVDTQDIIKIIDFNLARLDDDRQTYGFSGTQGYAAPELYHDTNVVFNQKIDLYSFGVTALSLIRGEPLPVQLEIEPPDPERWKRETGGFRTLLPETDSVLVELLDACVSEDPSSRPDIEAIRDRAERVLLRDRHQALLVDKHHIFEMTRERRVARVSYRTASVTIEYDSMDFAVRHVWGDVSVNDIPVSIGTKMPHGCVITMRDENEQSRAALAMVVSHPEIVI